MRRLARLRWQAFGLRGRMVAVVLITAVVTLLVAAVVLLPRLENSMRNAARKTLVHEVKRSSQDIAQLEAIPYSDVALASAHPWRSKQHRLGVEASRALSAAETIIGRRLGATNVTLVGYINRHGRGTVIGSAPGNAQAADEGTDDIYSYSDVATAFRLHKTIYSFGRLGNTPVVRAAIYMGNGSDSVLAVRKAIDEIPGAVAAVRRAFEIAAAVAILLALLLAIPLAGKLVGRLQRLREAALEMAVSGTGSTAEFPVDRARDEVGDLARSFVAMHRRLREQEEARRAFVATASHELRTPLASMDVMLELLAEDLQADSIDIQDAAMLLERARAQSRRLGRLAADLLDLSRIDAKVALRAEPLELGEIGRAVLAEFEMVSGERGVVSVLHEDQTQTWAQADPGSVAQILRILVDNALRVAPRGTEVRVEVSAGERPTITVSDEGPGVASAERTLIFERFQRGSETGGEAGFGLGLAIGRELAQRMGGSLVLREDKGPGASFTLTLPPASAPAADRIPDTVEA